MLLCRLPVVPDSGMDGGVDPGMWDLRVLACKVQPPLWQGEHLQILTTLKIVLQVLRPFGFPP